MRLLSVLLAVTFLLTGCTTSPTSGQPIFAGLVSESRENQLGASEHESILKQYHGVNDTAELNAFVAVIGARVAQAAERKDVNWRFTVVDDDMINAFAVPGGYIYVTRGLLAVAQDESQVAAVLAHEMGHINARHSAQQMSQGMIANIGLQALGIATGSNIASQLGGIGAKAYLSKYSRDHEYEADALGVRYLAATGYDPLAEAKFLTMLQNATQLEARMAGTEDAQQPGFFDSHPMTADRIARARALGEQQVKQADATVNRDDYLRAINGTVYGDAAEEGFVRGNEFIHPGLQIRFTVPQGFKIKNGSKQVLAENQNGAAIIFDAASAQTSDPAAYIAGGWAQGAPLSNEQRIEVNGMNGATATTRVSTSKGEKDAQLVALNTGGGKFYRLTFLAPVGQLNNYNNAYRTATYSFAHDPSVQNTSPNRIQVIIASAGDTIESLAARMPVQDYAVERFCLLNNLQPGIRLIAGQKVKIVQ